MQKNQYAKRRKKKLSKFLVLRKIWVTRDTAEFLDKEAKKCGLTTDVYDSTYLWASLRNGWFPTYSKNAKGSGDYDSEGLIARLILATLDNGILWSDLAMIAVDQGLLQDDISAGINGLVSKGMIKSEQTNEGLLFKFIPRGKVEAKHRVTSHRGVVIKKKRKKVRQVKMISKVTR